MGVGITVNDQYYLGQWQNNKFNGIGIYEEPQIGSKYIGELIDDKFQGFGIYIYPNGEKYLGFWKKDRFEGKGIYIYTGFSFLLLPKYEILYLFLKIDQG